MNPYYINISDAFLRQRRINDIMSNSSCFRERLNAILNLDNNPGKYWR